MDYPVFCGGRQAAVLSAEPQGLYWRLSLFAKKPPQRHLFAQEDGGQMLYLGTLVPTEAGWAFSRTIAKNRLPIERAQFFLAEKTPQGKIVTRDGEKLLRFLARKGQPFPMMDKIRYFSLVQTPQGLVWQCNLDAENSPFFVDKAANCDTINEVS